MCDVCCTEFSGWCKSFTKTERALTLMEGILLIVLISFVIFLILHFIACAQKDVSEDEVVTTSTPSENVTEEHTQSSDETSGTLPDGITCTWRPDKTEAATHYYENNSPRTVIDQPQSTIAIITVHDQISDSMPIEDEMIQRLINEHTEDEEPDEFQKRIVLALVKLKPLDDYTFGCILTIISQHWTITAASCIEAIEEVDALDAFVMLEQARGGASGWRGSRRLGAREHVVSDVQVHPDYRGLNASYDLAALKTDDDLFYKGGAAAELPDPLEYSLITIGERFTILGFGPLRMTESSERSHSLVASSVYKMPEQQCAARRGDGEESWAPRHMVRTGARAAATCARAELCAGRVWARGEPCARCSGTPLLLARRLLAVMSDDRQCGVSCEPTHYVNVALVVGWLRFIMDSD